MSNIGQSRWTDDLVERLLELVARMQRDPDIHFCDLADELGNGMTRNMVIGKINRLRRQGYRIPDLSDRIRRPSMPKPHRPRVKPVTLTTAPPAHEYVPLAPASESIGRRTIPTLPQLPEPAPVRGLGEYPLLELSYCQCRWPIGERAPFLFCGAPTEPERSYCAPHRAIAHRPAW